MKKLWKDAFITNMLFLSWRYSIVFGAGLPVGATKGGWLLGKKIAFMFAILFGGTVISLHFKSAAFD